MPIDLQWVRDSPKQVEEWQYLRKRPMHLVEQVRNLDTTCRQQIYELQQHRTKLKVCQQSLRPTANEAERREESLRQIPALQRRVADLEDQHRKTLSQRQRALAHLASPIDIQVGSSSHNVNTHRTRQQDYEVQQGPGLDLRLALLDYSRHHFGAIYHLNLLEAADMDDIDDNLALAVWGATNQGQPLPSWLRAVMRQTHGGKKSIWSAKHLPQVAALLDGDALHWVALTHASLWDARCQQSQWIDDLQTYFQSLEFCHLHVMSVAPPDLESHEVSRLEIWNRGKRNCRLAWISNWGDAPTRALQMVYAGGGTKGQDYVHLVQATVDRQETLRGLVQELSSSEDKVVIVPPSLQPFLVTVTRAADGKVTIPLQSLIRSKKQSPPVFASPLSSKGPKRRTRRFPLIQVSGARTKDQIRGEAATCPFDLIRLS